MVVIEPELILAIAIKKANQRNIQIVLGLVNVLSWESKGISLNAGKIRPKLY